MARAYLWTRDKRLGRMLQQSLPIGARGSSYGKRFSMYYCMVSRMLLTWMLRAFDLRAQSSCRLNLGCKRSGLQCRGLILVQFIGRLRT